MKLFISVAILLGVSLPAAAQSVSSSTMYHTDGAAFILSISTQVKQSGMACALDGTCMVSWTPKVGITTIVLDDKYRRLDVLRSRCLVLAQAVKNGVATQAEQDELLWKLTAVTLKQE